jgi:very-short-patch-repair endonuclease
MEIEMIRKTYSCLKPKNDITHNMLEYEIFQDLCDKAKRILWEFCSRPKNNFLYILGMWGFEGLSPIEQIFNAVLSIYTYEANSLPIYFEIYPQQEIQINGKNYRVDFCCKNFIFNCQYIELSRKIVIECDGYESHHTKQQRNKDTIRENELKLNGYSVIRFTGSQIYNEPFECFQKSMDFIIEQNKEQLDKLLGGKNAKTND